MAAAFRDFLSRVVPWPGDKPGYVNLHYTMVRPGVAGKPFWSGLPTQELDDFMSRATWAVKQDFIKDIYYCLSLQSEMKTDKKGKPKPTRLQKNVVALKAIWIDVDVKEPPKGYASLKEAIRAISAFVKETGLPSPTALVGSGGGVHVYWISDRPLTLEEWKPYAEALKTTALNWGLRCDAGCTVDSARVLRVPGTFNRKVDPPRPVKLLALQENDYDFTTAFEGIRGNSGKVAKNVSDATEPVLHIRDAASAFNVLNAEESLATGISGRDTPLPWKPLFEECAFFRKALETGGKDYDQPLWNLTTLLATFLEDGHELAHKMGNKHSGYDRASTEALWDRKNKERRDRGLGWPSCGAINTAGCGDCQACPHFKEGKSPLHFIHVPTVAAELAPAGAVINEAIETTLPKGFKLDPEGFICKIIVKESKDEDGPPVEFLVPIFNCHLSLPRVYHTGSQHTLSFTTTLDKGHTGRAAVDLETIQGGGVDLLKTLGRQVVKLVPTSERYLKEFLMAWITKLHNAQEALESVPFGWWIDQGKRHGFVYGGVIIKDGGRGATPSGMGDPVTRDIYQPTGDIKPWLDACRLITNQKRPELDAIVAASFAAPLMVSPAEYSALLSAWGTSGAGKSTAIKVGQAVWGHPKRSKEVTRTTANSVIHKMGQLRNLPVYWDEIKNKAAQKTVFETVFAGSEGIGPGRLTANIEQRARDDWQTMLITCSNLSFVDFVVSEQKTTAAGLYRVFEYHIGQALPDAPGQINAADASRITQELENNFGMVGMKYAELLGSDPAAADKFVMDTYYAFCKAVNATKEERFWPATCACLIAGARYANTFGAEIDIDRLTDFLVAAYHQNRQRMKDEATEGGTVIHTTEALTGFLKTYTENTLYTDTFPNGKGKPKPAKVFFGPDPNRPKPIHVQWAIDDRKLRISRPKFNEYMQEKSISPMQIMNGLRDYFNATLSYAMLAGGTIHRGGQEHIISIPIPPGSPLESQMLTHSPKNEEGESL